MEVRLGYSADTLVLKTKPKNRKKEKGKRKLLPDSPVAGIKAEIKWLHAELGLVAHACHPST